MTNLQTAVDVEQEYTYACINLLLSVTTKQGGKTVEAVEFTYDSEENRTTKQVTNEDGEQRTEFYHYNTNGNLISIGQQAEGAGIENLFNFYRDASGQLFSFEYKGQVYDYVYNQRGDVVTITDELKQVIARYTYDEWGHVEAIHAPTELGAEVAQANPFRYVGKFGVQYDNDTKLYCS